MEHPLPAEEETRLEGEDLTEFERILLADNVRRLIAIAGVGTLVNILIIATDLSALMNFDEISWLRIGWIAASLLYMAIVGKPGKRSHRFQKTVFLGAAGLSLLFSAIITGKTPASQGTTFLFIINTLLTSSFLFLSLAEMLGVVAPSAVCIVLARFGPGGGELAIAQTSNALNIVAVTAFSIMVAHVSHSSRKRRFAYELLIRRHNDFLAGLANLDGLTGVPNRRKIDETVEGIQALASREKIEVAALMIDLDDFKAFNDSRGHLAGDELLKRAAAAMKGVLLRDSDFFGRYGGEEFIAILPSTDAPGAAILAERMRQTVEELRADHPKSATGVATVSIGVATGIPSREEPVGELIARADLALYAAKHGGKNRIHRA